MADQLDIFEHCQHIRKTQAPDVLDDLLELTFVHVPTQTMLKRMRFYVWTDGATANWIRKHPTFSRGCWPVGLFTLHDWMWEKKFVEVETKEVVEGGLHDPSIGKTFIRAEFENFEEGTWFAPLVNIANTHIYDQLAQFYKDSPHAKTTAARIPQILADERSKADAKRRADLIAQMDRRHLLKTPTRNVKVFIDESGDVGFQNIRDVYVFAPVIVPDGKHTLVTNFVDGLRAKHWGESAPMEIHMSQVPVSKRAAVRADFATVIKENDISILGCIIEKEAFIKHLFRCHTAARRTEESPLNVSWDELINDKSYYLQANTLATTVELVVMHLALDFLTSGTAAVFTHDRKHRTWMNEALDLGFSRGVEEAKKIAQSFFGVGTAPAVSFAVADSRSEPCLWLSDWISNELRAWVFQKSLSPELESIKSNMSFLGFRSDGVKASAKDIGGVADQEFPDIPRLLVRGDPVQGENSTSDK